VLVLGEGFLSVSDELLSEGKSWVELGLTSGNDLHSVVEDFDSLEKRISALCAVSQSY
jgi:hypothetical protein